MPTNTIKNESTMEVLPMIAPRSKPILPPKVTTAIIISEEIAPEISPKVTMIFLISLVMCFIRSFIRPRPFHVCCRPHAHAGSATSHVGWRLGCRRDNYDQVIACSGVSHPKIIEVRQGLGVEPDVFRCHVRRIKHQVRLENASAMLGDRAQAVPAGHHVEEPRFARIPVTAFLISAGD